MFALGSKNMFSYLLIFELRNPKQWVSEVKKTVFTGFRLFCWRSQKIDLSGSYEVIFVVTQITAEYVLHLAFSNVDEHEELVLYQNLDLYTQRSFYGARSPLLGARETYALSQKTIRIKERRNLSI